MSKQVCHIQKFKSGDLKGIEIHNGREREGVSHTNPDIQWSRSGLNYDFVERHQTYSKAVKGRIDSLNLKKAVRKDAVTLVGVIVSSDSTFFDKMTADDQKDFFQHSYEFFCKRYGKENVISACVHNDETTPHMHVEIVPCTPDGRLSAKDLFGRQQLSDLQDEFWNEVGMFWGLERGERGSKAKHIDKAEYLLQQALLKEQETTLKALSVEKAENIALDAEKRFKGHCEALEAYCSEMLPLAPIEESYANAVEKGSIPSKGTLHRFVNAYDRPLPIKDKPDLSLSWCPELMGWDKNGSEIKPVFEKLTSGSSYVWGAKIDNKILHLDEEQRHDFFKPTTRLRKITLEMVERLHDFIEQLLTKKEIEKDIKK